MILLSPQAPSERNVFEELAQQVSTMPVPSSVPEQDTVAPPTTEKTSQKPQELADDVMLSNY